LKGITDELRSHANHSGILDKIYINIGIDGLPLAKSSKSQLRYLFLGESEIQLLIRIHLS